MGEAGEGEDLKEPEMTSAWLFWEGRSVAMQARTVT